MERWMRRIRGAVGLGLIWALAWFSAGLAFLLVVGFGAADVPFPLLWALLGFVAGVVFAGILTIAEGHRSFDEMSLARFAGWGGAGGLLFSGIFVSTVALTGDPSLLDNLLFLGPLFGLTGAASAAGSLALARMAGDGRQIGSDDGRALAGKVSD